MDSLYPIVKTTARDSKSGGEICFVPNASQTHILGEAAVIMTFADITQLHKAEEDQIAAEKLAALGQLTGCVAHDFNNLLRIIVIHAKDLHGVLPERSPARRLAETVVHASERGSVLTQRLLALSRPQARNQTSFNLNAALESMLGFLRRTLGVHIGVQTRLAAGLADVMLDRSQLETAVLNLALNARDAMPNGGVLTVETTDVTIADDDILGQGKVRPGRYAMLTVGDTGIGMPPSMLPRVFEPLFTTKDQDKSAGLGLSTIESFVKQSEGHVVIESEPDRGSTVRLYIPYARSGDRAPVVRATPKSLVAEAPLRPHGDGRTVLVVEDNVIVRAMIRTMLADLDYEVVEAANGKDALLELVEAGGHIDALLTDVVLPGGMSGIETAAALRRRLPSISVVMMTGYSPKALRRNGLSQDDRVFLNKPFRKTELAEALTRAMGGRLAAA